MLHGRWSRVDGRWWRVDDRGSIRGEVVYGLRRWRWCGTAEDGGRVADDGVLLRYGEWREGHLPVVDAFNRESTSGGR